jgi:hypothetical protein
MQLKPFESFSKAPDSMFQFVQYLEKPFQLLGYVEVLAQKSINSNSNDASMWA